MNSETPRKPILLAVLMAVVGLTVLVVLTNQRRQPAEQPSPLPKLVRDSANYHYTPPPRKFSANADTNVIELEAPDDPYAPLRLPREKAEAWLAKHHRDAASLLAVFRAQRDTNYLNEAATNFPNDPRVQLAVLSADAFPEDRRKWLEALKQSSPSNSMADFLSAQNYFKEGKTEAALQDLMAASGKPQLDSHTLENELDAEELYADAGKTAGESAKLGAMNSWSEYGKQLLAIKEATQGIREVMEEKSGANDTGANVQLAQLGLGIAEKLNPDDNQNRFSDQWVSIAIKAIMLNHLDQNTVYDFLDGQTPAQRLVEQKQQVAERRKFATNLESAMDQMTDAEQASFYQRVKISGDQAAMKWVVKLHPPTDPQP